MNRNTRLRRAAAMIAALGIMVEPSAHLLLVASGQGQAPPPQTTTATGKPAPAASTAKPAAGAATTTPVDGGWPRLYDLPSGGSILVYQPQVATWDKQTHMVAFSAVSLRNKAGDKPALGTIKLEADTKVAVTDRLVSFQQHEDHRGNLSDAPEGTSPRDYRSHRAGDSQRRKGDCARSRSGQHGQEHDRAEDGRRHQGRSSSDLLQQDPGCDRESRWRPDLESDQGQRSEIRGEHELGSVREHPYQDVLPSKQRHVAEGDRCEGTVVAGGDAAGRLQAAAGRGQLERRQGKPARQSDQNGATGLRQHDAG